MTYHYCRTCGQSIVWSGRRPYEANGEPHKCMKTNAVKVFNEKERREFERERLSN